MTNDWRSACVPPSMLMEQGITKLNQNCFQILLICENNRMLAGTVTDGDIRRALIRGLTLDTPLEQLMNTSPVSANQADSLVRIRQLMEKFSVNQLPVLEKGKVIGLHTYKSLTQNPIIDLPVLLMAGGYGKRLRPLTDHCPKPLLKIGDKAILETIIENFVTSGFSRFYITTHYLDSMIKKHFGNGQFLGARIKYIHEEVPLGTAGALGSLPSEEDQNPVIMMNGDILTNLSFGRLTAFHLEQNHSATLCVRQHDYQIPYGVVESNRGHISHITEKPIIQHFINAGIYVINPELRALVRPQQTLDMPTLVNQGIKAGLATGMYPIHEYWLDIGHIPDYKKAQRDYFEGLSA